VTSWTDSLLPCQLFLAADDGSLISFGHGEHAPVTLARALIEAGRPQEALPISAELVGAHSDRPEYVHLRADALEASGDSVAAREVTRRLAPRTRGRPKPNRSARTG
jgi:predicted Zn-dependent protease